MSEAQIQTGLRTAKQWFDIIKDEPMKEMALAALDHSPKGEIEDYYGSLKDALCAAILWTETKEGWDFWKGIATEAHKIELILN